MPALLERLGFQLRGECWHLATAINEVLTGLVSLGRPLSAGANDWQKILALARDWILGRKYQLKLKTVNSKCN
jgi:hypothetical protein